MIEKLFKDHSKETLGRSIVKTIIFRVIITVLDFILIYLYTQQMDIALGFIILSNIYSTPGYFINERIWNKIKQGKIIYKKLND